MENLEKPTIDDILKKGREISECARCVVGGKDSQDIFRETCRLSNFSNLLSHLRRLINEYDDMIRANETLCLGDAGKDNDFEDGQ